MELGDEEYVLKYGMAPLPIGLHLDSDSPDTCTLNCAIVTKDDVDRRCEG